MVGNNSELKNHFTELQNLVAQKNGFVYIYCSNETAVEVFFDNLQVVHTRGAILEENSYYPFGERMFNICAAASGGMDNRKKYNGIEFDNDLDINTYEAPLRDLDPQIGRWWQIDPLTEKMEMWSPYTSNYDNPIRYSDPKGDEPCCGVNPITDFIEMKLMEWSLDLQIGYDNTMSGSAKMASTQQGTNRELPVIAQKMQALGGKLQTTAGIAQMVKPGLEAANMIGGALVGVELAEAPMVTGGSAWFGADVYANPSNVNLAVRATEIHGALKPFTQRMNTTAVASATTSDGRNVTLVGSNEYKLRGSQMQALKSGEVAVQGNGHAEATIINHAKANGMTVNSVAASRGICASCATAINGAGATTASPLKVTNVAASTSIQKPRIIGLK
jgi:RHS repeat-associated protein